MNRRPTPTDSACQLRLGCGGTFRLQFDEDRTLDPREPDRKLLCCLGPMTSDWILVEEIAGAPIHVDGTDVLATLQDIQMVAEGAVGSVQLRLQFPIAKTGVMCERSDHSDSERMVDAAVHVDHRSLHEPTWKTQQT